jgi:hypothetical protein
VLKFQTVIAWARHVTLEARGREHPEQSGAASFAANRDRFDRHIGGVTRPRSSPPPPHSSLIMQPGPIMHSGPIMTIR